MSEGGCPNPRVDLIPWQDAVANIPPAWLQCPGRIGNGGRLVGFVKSPVELGKLRMRNQCF